ncbi:ATP-dependent nuclease [Pseudomonas viridiflava]|uniref:ATP-dependent nuclease n=1 Tax=Pseudomonas viridiflava TaxID=33069 RepID=UPI000F0282E9|nr:ATP-binding protein [Pseudomonas viridiflava]
MARIRYVEIRNFRGIKQLNWAPREGINCLIGPGDSGKTSILDAIEACMCVRRNIEFSDADFYEMDVSTPITIRITVGALPDHLMDLDTFGEMLRGFNPTKNVVEDEPGEGLEVVLTLQLLVGDDLDPKRALYSKRTEPDPYQRQLQWKDKAMLAPSRIGNHSSMNLSWTKSSVLARLSEEKLAVGNDLVSAAREARLLFGDKAGANIGDILDLVTIKAKQMGIEVGEKAKALLDAKALSFSDGAIALHSDDGVPLRNLGTGSSRLLLAALHREASSASSCLLVDEVEHGLEPHRVISLLHSLGSKDTEAPIQVFMTTHSAVAVRELSGDQLVIVRKEKGGEHQMQLVSSEHAIQGVARLYPEAFLARTVIVCEGASEVGLLRGIDRYRVSQGMQSAYAGATAFVDAGGRNPTHILERAQIFAQWGYQTKAFLDADLTIPKEALDAAEMDNVIVCTWDDSLALEEALFKWLPDYGVDALIKLAIELNSEELVDGALEEVSKKKFGLKHALSLVDGDAIYEDEERALLGKAAKLSTKDSKAGPGRKGWFKSISKMELVGERVVGPWMKEADPPLKRPLLKLFRRSHVRR